jgi:hypothetical protein
LNAKGVGHACEQIEDRGRKRCLPHLRVVEALRPQRLDVAVGDGGRLAR